MKGERTWTDDDLRSAVATSTTYRAVLRLLGLREGSLGYIKSCIQSLAIDTAHFDSRAKKWLCSDELIREVVRSSKSRSEVLAKLGIDKHSNAFEKLKRQIRRLDIDTSHFTIRGATADMRRTRWSEEELRQAVSTSRSYAEVIRTLGLIPAGGNYEHIRRRIRHLAVDTSHFTGQGWNKGLQFRPSRPHSLEQVLVANRWTSSYNLKLRLFKAGLKKEACELCGWSERSADGRVPVELDHINGKKDDNRLENLRILCPNCHSLQSTHRGLNQRRRKRPSS